MRLCHVHPICDSLLSKSGLPEFENLRDLLIGELGTAVRFVRDPTATTPIVSVLHIVCVGSILKMIGIHAGPVVTFVAAYLGPAVIPQKEGQAMRQDALLVSAKFAVSGLVLSSGPFPATAIGDDRTGPDVALGERLLVHTSSVSYFNG
jgi:hypothetical protein